MMFARSVLWLGGLAFLGFGTWLLLAPADAFALFGMQLDGALLTSDIRATYGGLELGLGIAILAAAGARQRLALRHGLLLHLLCYAGLGLARLYGIWADRPEGSYPWIASAVELGLALLGAIALARLPRTDRYSS